jgi:hypothetical protein
LRSTFGSSPLVRQLAAWSPAEVEASGMDFAERLSVWLNAFDAIALQSAHQSLRSVAPGARPGPRARTGPGRGREARALGAGTGDRAGSACRSARLCTLPAAACGTAAPDGTDDHAAARARPPGREPHFRGLRQLAVLDAAFEQVLARREQASLSATSALLKRRFEQLHADAAPPETFAAEWRQALLAELELRLEPVTGLAEALRNELKNRA